MGNGKSNPRKDEEENSTFKNYRVGIMNVRLIPLKRQKGRKLVLRDLHPAISVLHQGVQDQAQRGQHLRKCKSYRSKRVCCKWALEEFKKVFGNLEKTSGKLKACIDIDDFMRTLGKNNGNFWQF